MFKRIDHIELVAQDSGRLERFYTDVLGFRLRSRTSVPGGLELTYLDLGGTTVELIHYAEARPAPREAGGPRRSG